MQTGGARAPAQGLGIAHGTARTPEPAATCATPGARSTPAAGCSATSGPGAPSPGCWRPALWGVRRHQELVTRTDAFGDSRLRKSVPQTTCRAPHPCRQMCRHSPPSPAGAAFLGRAPRHARPTDLEVLVCQLPDLCEQVGILLPSQL
eukprot:365842-Chlamydomonas_euryale.AAC.10